MSYIRPRGFGDAVSQIGSASSGLVATGGGMALASAVGLTASLAIPIVGAAFAGVLAGIEAILHSGCGQTCVVTSQWANQASSKLDQMMAAYFSIPAPRPQSLQQGCMAIFQQVWNTLVQQCSQPNLGTAGQNCIADRQDGACKWKALAPAYPGEPAAGSCWNWWNAYYYPIANDPDVVPDSQLSSTSASAASVAAGSLGTSAASSNWLLLAVAVGVGLWALS